MADEPGSDSPEATPEPIVDAPEEAVPEVAVPEVAVHDAASHARPRRSAWRVTLGVVGVVAAVAIAAVAGVAYGRASAPGPDIVVQPEPVVEESSGAEPMAAGGVAPLPSAGAGSAGAPALQVAASRPSAWPVLLTADPSLPDTTGTATGYRLVNAGISGAQVAAVLGPTFGATGQPVAAEGSWAVGEPDGARLVVTDDPLFSWTFIDPAGLAAPAPGRQIEPARAIELTATLLGSIGVDTASVDWQVDRYFDRTTVTAWQLVEGERTQLAWQVAYDPSGAVVQASGFSAGLEAVPDYPVVGAATAVTRIGAAPWSALGPSPVSGAVTEPASAASPSASASAPPSRPGLTVPMSTVTATGADLGLSQYWQPDGSVVMLPAYIVTGSDGSRWSVLAVDDAHVQFVDQPYPMASPAGS